MDADGHAHEHVLDALHHHTVGPAFFVVVFGVVVGGVSVVVEDVPRDRKSAQKVFLLLCCLLMHYLYDFGNGKKLQSEGQPQAVVVAQTMQGKGGRIGGKTSLRDDRTEVKGNSDETEVEFPGS